MIRAFPQVSGIKRTPERVNVTAFVRCDDGYARRMANDPGGPVASGRRRQSVRRVNTGSSAVERSSA